jgi:sulfur carrier protein ThiS
MKQDGHNSAGKSVRDQHGRFLPGNPGNVAGLGGRPPRAVEDRYLATLRATVTPERWEAICKRAVADALQTTDTPARTAAVKWLAKYLLPEPTHDVNIGGTLADLLAAMAGKSDTALDG